ncbi:MAG TPA: division/cell wall cluster transcriptional repressor MraZ [Longimicrobiaceae bacterium]|jgi:MraZ protein|nr:division/cell wall cluster transcriptional repressor MraZ [Longimicrobiaceae bacterium]
MSGFLGSYLHQIDDKGRLNLPAPFRRDHPDRPLVLVHVFENALTLYPEPAWAEVESRLRELLRLQPQARSYVLSVTANAVEVVPDKQGRILVPQRLQEAVGIRGATLVVGAIDRIELWDPERFQAALPARSDDFDRFNHQIFA